MRKSPDPAWFMGRGIPRRRIYGCRGDLYYNTDSFVVWIKILPLSKSDPPDVEGWILPPPLWRR